MKTSLMRAAAAVLTLILLAGCGKSPDVAAPAAVASADTASVFEIREKMFIQQCNDIYLNPDEYAGRTVRLEGIYDEFFDEYSGELYCYVIRYGPGCCGNDGVAGFECVYDENFTAVPGDWVEAVGTVEVTEIPSGPIYVALKLSALTVLDERGEEFVTS
jgi:uncharacterized membrane protein YcgQ (UPF0703/DUF1980 family)